MIRILASLIACLAAACAANAQTSFLSISGNDFQVSNVFSDVDTFQIDIEINRPLSPGVYNNPDIVGVVYSVSGNLTPGTPSGFPAFALQRDISGTEFYAQGSSLSFEIGQAAVLGDGIQAAELVGNGVILTFNGREIDNGRFHPALLELNSNGSGRIQNSDNIVSNSPFQQVAFGEEYITDLMYDPGNTTVITGTPTAPQPRSRGATSLWEMAMMLLLVLFLGLQRRLQGRR